MAEIAKQTNLTLPTSKPKLAEQGKSSHKTSKQVRDKDLTTIDSSEDRISDLPISIMHYILSFLPVKDAVKVCTLSKDWNSLWTSIPNLAFHHEFDRYKIQFYGREGELEESDKLRRFASFVDKTLMKYTSSKIKKFLLDFPYLYWLKDQFESWLHFAASHEVEELYLHFDWCENYSFPDFLLRNCFLTKLSLREFDHLNDRTFGGSLRSLKVLCITETNLQRDAITGVLRVHPAIQYLTLCRCSFSCRGSDHIIDSTNTSLKELVMDSCQLVQEPFHQLEIKAPRLKSLRVVGYMSETILKLVDVSSVVEANIDFWMDPCSEPTKTIKGPMKGIIQQLRHANKLTVGAWCLQVLSIMRLDGEIFTSSTCKSLKINMKLGKKHLPGMVALLDSSLHLQQLIINMMPLDESQPPQCFRNGFPEEEENYWNSVQENYLRSETGNLRCLIQDLKSVEIVGVGAGLHPGWSEGLVEMVHFLLENSQVLQTLTIHARADDLNGPSESSEPLMNKLFEIKQKILEYPRASPGAMVVLEI